MKERKPASPRTGAESTVHEKPAKESTADGKEEDCRCKEVSKKTPMELLKLMISDLAIWKK